MVPLASPASWFGAIGAWLLLGTAAAAQAVHDDQSERPEVRDIDLRGVRAVPEEELLRSIATEESSCRGLLLTPFCWFSRSRYFFERKYLDRAELRRDVLRIRVFYWKRGYRDAAVDTVIRARGDDAVAVAFVVREGPATRVGTLTVNRPGEVLSDREIAGRMQLRAGQPLDLLALDSSLVLLRNALWQHGYADAAVTTDSIVVDTAARAARVVVAIDPKWRTRVGEIRISGNDQVEEATIRNSLTMKPGDVYRRSALVESQRNLYESNLFRHATIVVPPQGDSVKTVEITVRESPLQEVRLSGGFNTYDFVQVDGRYTHHNWFGGARRIDTQAAVGNLLARRLNGVLFFKDVLGSAPEDVDTFGQPTWQASADLTQRWFRSPHNSIGVGVFAHRRAAAGIYVDRGQGVTSTFTRVLAPRAPLSLNYRYEITRVEAGDIYFCVNYGVCDRGTIGALRANQRLSPLTLTGRIDRSNDAFSPTAGYQLRAESEYASRATSSDFHYTRAFADGALYRRVGHGMVFASHARLGIVRPLGASGGTSGSGLPDPRAVLHPRKRFYAGGAQSVRGFGENQLGPRILTIAPQALAAACDTSAAAIANCPKARLDSLSVRAFTPRPLGGTALVEGSVELRMPVWRQLSAAIFLDGALLGEATLQEVASGTGAITPGFGFRYHSPVGPIRVDLGINPYLSEELAVATQVEADGERRIVTLRNRRTYAPLAGVTGIRGLLSRLTLHLSIGEAY